jgi:eukaryotic-like serine/threonine-protein kinase
MTQSCPACGTAIDTSEAEPLTRIGCPSCGQKTRVERTFDHFEVIETLGVGGMGSVYKARDTRLDRFVALKLLRRELGGEKEHAARFQHEARIAGSVNHPNVIRIFSSGTDHGQFYVVMELVERGSLDDLIEERKRLPEEHVLGSGIQVANGLHAAQQQGLIHRDVKPANILFVDENTAKISDFGLAGVVGEISERKTEIWGTPYYVAPERLSNGPEDFRSDIYSLGATLFHAVAGKAPIEGDTNSAAALLDLKKRPLALRAVAPDLSEATASVIQRMIEPNPAQRFSSYDELLSELEEAQHALKSLDNIDLIRPRWRQWLARLRNR